MPYLQPQKLSSLVFKRGRYVGGPASTGIRLIGYGLAALTASALSGAGYLIYVDRKGEEERQKLIEMAPQTRYGFELLDKSSEAASDLWTREKNRFVSKVNETREHYLPRKKKEEAAQPEAHLVEQPIVDTLEGERLPALVEVTVESAEQAIKDALAHYNDLYDYLLDTLNAASGAPTTVPAKFVEALAQCNHLLNSSLLTDEESSRLRESVRKLRELVNVDNLVVQLKQKVDHARKATADEVDLLTSLTVDTSVADSLLLAHAHRKIKELEAKLACESTLRDGRVEAELVRRLDDRFAEIEARLRRKVAREEAEKMEKRIDDELRRYGALLEGRHAQNLLEQRALLEEEMQKNMDKAILELTVKTHNEMATLEAKLDTLRSVINSKMVAEERSRQSQQLWIEASRLAEAALQRTDRLAVLSCLKKLRTLPGRSAFSDEIADLLADLMTQGLLNSGTELIARFAHVRKVADHVIGVNEQHESLLRYAKAYLMSIWRRLSGVPRTVHLSKDGFLDLDHLSPERILAIASGFVASEDLLSAVRVLQLLTGKPREVFDSWLQDTIRFLAVKQNCDLMVALATSACLSNSPQIV